MNKDAEKTEKAEEAEKTARQRLRPLQHAALTGELAQKIHDAAVRMAVNLSSSKAITEDRQDLLHEFFCLALAVNALETKAPVATGAGG